MPISFKIGEIEPIRVKKLNELAGSVGAAAGVTSFNTRVGAVTLTSADVTTALTYTPQPTDATLTALAGLNATAGLVEQTGADAFTKRAIGVAAATDIPTRGDADARYSGIAHQTTAITASGHNMATARMLGRTTAAVGAIEELTNAQAKTFLAIAAADVSGLGYFATGTDAANLTGTVAAARLPQFTGGDVTTAAAGSVALTIGAGVVTLAMQANVATASVFYRKTAGAGAPEVQTLATLKTDLGLTGTNSGDQTSIVGITGTLAQFNAAITDADIQPLDATLTALAGLNATAGLVEQTGADAFTKRAIGVAAATDIPTRGDGDGRWLSAVPDPYTPADGVMNIVGGLETTANCRLTGTVVRDDPNTELGRLTLTATSAVATVSATKWKAVPPAFEAGPLYLEGASVHMRIGGVSRVEATSSGVAVAGTLSATGDVSGANLSGTNTGNQTSIVGITGTLAEFNTALTGADFATGGGTATGANTGDQTITLTGDVTGSGTGSFAATIANDAVTFVKMLNATAASVLMGRGQGAGAGDFQEITLGTNLSMTGTVLNAASGSSGDLALNKHILAANFTVTAAYASFIARYLEIGATFALEIGAGADMEIG